MQNIFEISKSGLFAAQKSMDLTSNNIANANTPGYTRQRTDLSAETLRQNGFVLGRGVSVDQVQRTRSELTDQQIRLKENELGDLNERSRIYQQIESALVTSSGDDLDVAMSNFFSSFSELSNNPQDMNLRNVVISKAHSLSDKFQNTASDLADIKDRVADAAATKVDEINRILNGLADVNMDVARTEASNQPDLNSKDQQTQLMKELSELVDVNASYNSNGTVEARIGGIVVLNDQEVSELSLDSGPGSNTLGLQLLDNGTEIKPGKGSLSADIHMFEEAIPETQNKLDKIASSLVNQVNAEHSNGYGLEDATQRDFFDPAGTTAGSVSINADILSNPEHIAASSVPDEPGNNDNSLMISEIQNLAVLDGATLNNNAIEMMSRPGLKLSELEQNISSKESARQMLVNQQQSESGVNVDEELSNLIKYQNAYQASAKVLNIGQRNYDTLLGIL